MNTKKYIPWQIKLTTKILLDNIPFLPQGIWAKIGLFKYGPINNPEYAFNVFQRHYNLFDFPNKNNDFIGLELGPGNTLFSAMIAYAFNASKFYLVDVGPFARFNEMQCQNMGNYISSQGLVAPIIGKSLKEFLEYCRADYLTHGINSLKTIPENLIDFAFSQAVLEHIRLTEFQETHQEIFRILKPGGICSHTVDLKDHLNYALNQLRFSEKAWESFASPSFYINRLRYSEMIEIFEKVGFKIEHQEIKKWGKLPTPKNKLIKRYQAMPEEELLIKEFNIVLRKS